MKIKTIKLKAISFAIMSSMSYNIVTAAPNANESMPISKKMPSSANNRLINTNDMSDDESGKLANPMEMTTPSKNRPQSSRQKSKSQSINNGSVTAPSLDDNKVVLNFENADIQSVIKAISKLSGKNFVIDPRVKGTVNIVSDKPIAKSESYKVLESALRMQGFATVEANGVIKVLPEADARTYGMQTLTGNNEKKNGGDQVVTKVFVIERGSAMQLANALRPLIAPNNNISVYPNTNSLIVTDYASNLNRINTIIKQLSDSSQTSSKPVIVHLNRAVAADVAQTLQAYMQGGNAGGSIGGGGSSQNDGVSASITVEAQTNSLIINSLVKEKQDELKNLAIQLDNNIGANNNNLHVVYLRNADAAHVADVLRVVANGQENPDLTATSSQMVLSQTSTAFGSSGSGGGSGGGSGFGSTSGTQRPTSSASRGSSGTGQQGQNAPKIIIQAEPTTNSLIIQAPESMYRNLRMIIDMLDVRRAQVMIEAMIADISSVQGGAFGIQWVVGGGNNNIGAIGVANYGDGANSLSSMATTVATGVAAVKSGSATTVPTLPNQVYIGLVTGTTTIGGQTVPGLGALANMITSNSMGNILTRPTLLTMDNEEASIMVGAQIGIPNGSTQNNNGNPFNTYTRQNTGTVLKFKPLITQNGTIQLAVHQEDSSVDQSTLTLAAGPTINMRTLDTSLLVDDGQIIALGGMTSDKIAIVKNGIPLLSDIPYLGWLFSWQSRTHTQSNLVLFLRPVIIKNMEGYKALTNQRYRYVVDQQNTVQATGNALLPAINPVTMDNQVPNMMEKQANDGSSLNLNKSIPIVDVRNETIKNGGTVGVAPEIKTTTIQHRQNTDDVNSSTIPLITPKNQ